MSAKSRRRSLHHVNGGTGSGGTDVWISFSDSPDFSILPPSSSYAPDQNETSGARPRSARVTDIPASQDARR
jgi:hypothetical protein